MTARPTRRKFISSVAIGLALAGCRSASSRAGLGRDSTPKTGGSVPKRKLGSTGESVSMIGLGGFHIGKGSEAEALRLMHRAIDHDLTFFDNCWDYNGGESERRMGKALQGRRDQVFLMTKIDGRTREAAAKQIDQSLKRLRTDHVDLMQVHEVIRMSDPERVFGDDGTIAALLDARRAGKLRYIGFTGHKSPDIHLAMLNEAQKHDFHFDTVQMPLNAMDAHYESFQKRVLPVLLERGIGVLGMKTLGSGILLQSGVVEAPECLRYALSLPTDVVITGIENDRDLEQALAIARGFQPMSESERQALLARTEDAAKNGKFEKFKTSDRFDGTARNPGWLTSAEL